MTIAYSYQQAIWRSQAPVSPSDGGRRRSSTGGTGGPKPLLTDVQVLECRARHEFHGWKPLRCAAHYGTRYEYMVKLLSYETRSRLIAKLEHANLQESHP